MITRQVRKISVIHVHSEAKLPVKEPFNHLTITEVRKLQVRCLKLLVFLTILRTTAVSVIAVLMVILMLRE